MATVMTVTGPVSADQLGFTLVHEHLYYGMEAESGDNWDRVYGRNVHDSDQIFEQLMEYKNAGGVTFVDQTTGGLYGKGGNILLEQSSEPVKHSLAVREMAERTGLNIILGTGWYRVPFYDPYIYDIKTDELAEKLVRDITEGLHGTDVKAGILGEIGVENATWVWPVEERMLRAVARAHKQTGVTIATHAVGGPVGLDQLEILEEEGVDPGRVIIGHVSLFHNHEYHAEVARRGAFIAFDTIKAGQWAFLSRPSIEHILMALDAGLIDHILMSHDVSAFGAGGYDQIPNIVRGDLRERGVTDEQFHQIMVDNPRRALTGED